MKLAVAPHIDAPGRVEAVPVPTAVSSLQATDALSVKQSAALLATQPGAASGLVELSALGQSVATLSAFGWPVAVLPGGGPQDALLPGAQHQDTEGVIQALVAALTLKQATELEDWAPGQAEQAASHAHAPAREHERAASEPGTPARSPAQQSAGSLLNAMLCASLTGQTAVEVRRWDRRPLRLELQREPDGRGGFRMVRARVRHETAQGVLDAVVELGVSISDDGQAASAMNVDIISGEGLVREVQEHVDELRQALDARGLSAKVRAMPAQAED